MNNHKAFKRIIDSIEGAPAICVSGKHVVFSDLHYNEGGDKNDSEPYLDVQRKHIFPYYSREGYKAIVSEGFDVVEAGCYENIWNYTPNRDNIKMLVDMTERYLPGNHELFIADANHYSLSGLKFADCLRLYSPDGNPLGICQHGHLGDKWNYGGKITRAVNWVVRHVWAKWQDSRRASSNLDLSNDIEECYLELAHNAGRFNCKPYVCLIGHTHRAALRRRGYGIYLNSGCMVRPNGGHCIEIENGTFRLVFWDLLGNRKVERALDICK